MRRFLRYARYLCRPMDTLLRETEQRADGLLWIGDPPALLRLEDLNEGAIVFGVGAVEQDGLKTRKLHGAGTMASRLLELIVASPRQPRLRPAHRQGISRSDRSQILRPLSEGRARLRPRRHSQFSDRFEHPIPCHLTFGPPGLPGSRDTKHQPRGDF